MNLRLDVEKINNINFIRQGGSINLDIPDYEVITLLGLIDLKDIFNYLEDRQIINNLLSHVESEDLLAEIEKRIVK